MLYHSSEAINEHILSHAVVILSYSTAALAILLRSTKGMQMRSNHATCTTITSGLALTLALISPRDARANPARDLNLTSPAFGAGQSIPSRYTCSGENKSPPLHWTGVPAGTSSLALIVEDPDAPMGTFVHWVIYNLPGASTGLPEGVSASATAEGGEQGLNGRGTTGYMGPCPPAGSPHHYHFRLYALDEKLRLPEGDSAKKVEAALKAHVRSSTQLIGIFAR
jgi:Raf kinase inhibitor-like YbhB/YbcL family protein